MFLISVLPVFWTVTVNGTPLKDGVPCSCGRRGCWEAYSSATALIRMTKEKLQEVGNTSKMWDMVEGDLDKVSGRTAFAAAREGDKAGQEVVDLYLDYLASGVASMINIFQPEIFSIGGGISNEGDYLLDLILDKVHGEQFAYGYIPETKICIAQLKNDAGIIGAASLGM